MAVSSAVKHTSQDAKQKLGTAELLFQSAERMGLRPCWITPGGLFAVSLNGQERYINFARSPLNSHTGTSLTKNKYLTRLVLERHQMPNIPFMRPDSHLAASTFLQVHGKIIAKPLTGSGAHDIHLITTTQQLRKLHLTRYILEKYIVGQELRYLVLNGTVIGVHRSDYGSSVREDRSLQRISYHYNTWDSDLVSSTIRIAHVLGLNFAAVDYLVSPGGRTYILEVNSSPGLKWFHAPTSGPVVDVARQFLEAAFQSEEIIKEANNG